MTNPKDFHFERVIENDNEQNVRHRVISFDGRCAEYTIGRHANCDKTIEGSKAISRFHCRILFLDSKIFIEDLSGKSNGTFLNGDKVSSRTNWE
jgi:pSer/pThr/pTyr-binding forkhead associated (FHA) protein